MRRNYGGGQGELYKPDSMSFGGGRGNGMAFDFSDFSDENGGFSFSFGNGSAMRVSSAAWLYEDLDTVRRMARLSAEVTHNHPEGIKGAEATASGIYLARTGHYKAEIKTYIET